MSKMFFNQVNHYKEKFRSTVNSVTIKSIEDFARSSGVSDDALRKGFESNSKEFRTFVYSFAKTLMPGRVSCTTYAAVVALIASKFNVDFKAMAGFCLQKNAPNYAKDLADFNQAKQISGDEHPLFATHVYLQVGDTTYEYYNGDTSNIDHIDCVDIFNS